MCGTWRSLLPEAEGEIDPVVQSFRHVGTLEGVAVLGDEVFGAVGPRRVAQVGQIVVDRLRRRFR